MDDLQLMVDFCLDVTELESQGLFNLWRRKIKSDKNLDDWQEELLRNEKYVGVLVPMRAFMEIMKLLSSAKKELGSDEPLCVSVEYAISNGREIVQDFSAVNTRAYNAPFDHDFPAGMNTDGLWMVGTEGFACIESKAGDAFTLFNPLSALKGALETAAGPEKALECMERYAEDMLESMRTNLRQEIG